MEFKLKAVENIHGDMGPALPADSLNTWDEQVY